MKRLLTFLALAAALLSASTPTSAQTTTCQTIGDTTYCHNPDGTTTVCQTIGNTTYCHTY